MLVVDMLVNVWYYYRYIINIKNNAIKLTNIYLLISSMVIIYLALIFYNGPKYLGRAIGFLLYFMAWYFYFKKSKRVKNTFGG
jgi:hypothetical protein